MDICRNEEKVKKNVNENYNNESFEFGAQGDQESILSSNNISHRGYFIIKDYILSYVRF